MMLVPFSCHSMPFIKYLLFHDNFSPFRLHDSNLSGTLESSDINLSTIGMYNSFENIIITGAGLFFVLRTLNVLRRGFLFDVQLGKLLLTLSLLNIVLTSAVHLSTHMPVAYLLTALSLPVLVLLICILYIVATFPEPTDPFF